MNGQLNEGKVDKQIGGIPIDFFPFIMVILFFLCLLFYPQVSSIQCIVCDSFSDYCQMDEKTCVGGKCATRTAILPQGFNRLQKLCVSGETESGCRDTLLWQGRPGKECVCHQDYCNSSPFYHKGTVILLLLVAIVEHILS